MSSIFVSYRRDDSPSDAGRICDHLINHFGKDQVFFDIDSIPPGEDFVKFLNGKVSACEILVAVIGSRWLKAADETGRRRLDNPDDFVRIEIATALQRDITVFPVLVGGAQLPRFEELPQELGPLVRRQAIQLQHVGFGHQMEILIKAITETTKLRGKGEAPSPRSRPPTELSASSGPWSTFRRSATLKAALGVILACTLGLIAFEISQNRTVKNPENKTQAEVQSGNLSDVNVSNMIIECDPACTANADFILTVTNLGDTGLSGKVPSGVAELGVLLPEPTGLSRWVLKSDGNLPIDSGTGVPGYTAGSVFPLFAQSANDPIDFSTFQAASASVGVKVTNYNAFAFGLGSFNSSGSSIRPISFTAFQGALGFPAGTIFFAFLADSNSGGRVVNRTPNAKLVVVAPRH